MDPGFRFDDSAFPSVPATQDAWEIPGISRALDLEHAQNRTTSVDHKIQRQMQAKALIKKRKHLWNSPAVGQGGADEVQELRGVDDSVPDEADMEGQRAEKLNGRENSENEQGKEAEEEEEEEEDEEEDSGTDVEEEVEERRERENAEGPEGRPKKKWILKKLEKKRINEKRSSRVQKETPQKPATARPRPGKFFSPAGEGTSFSARSFAELKISRPLIKACEALGYSKPTPIQAACVPLALTGRDICGSAMTGSGKTAAFALPILERLLYRPRRVAATRVLILTPTRELAVQVHGMIEKLAQFTDIRACLVVGGLSNKVQEVALRTHPDIVVATPGRMLDHLSNAVSVGLEELAILVLDEADRLLEMGFQAEVQELVRLCPKRRQTLLFSATMTEQVSRLVQLSLNNPVRLSADPTTQRPSTLTEEVMKVTAGQEGEKEALLLALCRRSFQQRAIIFCGQKVEAHRLKLIFGLAEMKAGELHGNLTQAMRLEALESFRKGETDFLIATDVAARGLDITGVQTVINMECPRDITTYVHRVGRTARAGKRGAALTFVGERDKALLKAMSKRAGSKLKVRSVPPSAVARCRALIEDIEGDVTEILAQEREERAMRKAEMEVNKAQNMMEFEEEIMSRPPKVWFQSVQEKRTLAEAAKVAKEGGGEVEEGARKVQTRAEAMEKKKKEKLKREREKSLPRKKRRALEARREMEREAKEEREEGEEGGEGGVEAQEVTPGKRRRGEEAPKKTVVEASYRRAKGVKSAEKLRAAGKIVVQPERKKAKKKAKKSEQKPQGEGGGGGSDSCNSRGGREDCGGGGFRGGGGGFEEGEGEAEARSDQEVVQK